MPFPWIGQIWIPSEATKKAAPQPTKWGSHIDVREKVIIRKANTLYETFKRGYSHIFHAIIISLLVLLKVSPEATKKDARSGRLVSSNLIDCHTNRMPRFYGLAICPTNATCRGKPFLSKTGKRSLSYDILLVKKTSHPNRMAKIFLCFFSRYFCFQIADIHLMIMSRENKWDGVDEI